LSWLLSWSFMIPRLHLLTFSSQICCYFYCFCSFYLCQPSYSFFSANIQPFYICSSSMQFIYC
jgi:hypothetical protein